MKTALVLLSCLVTLTLIKSAPSSFGEASGKNATIWGGPHGGKLKEFNETEQFEHEKFTGQFTGEPFFHHRNGTFEGHHGKGSKKGKKFGGRFPHHENNETSEGHEFNRTAAKGFPHQPPPPPPSPHQPKNFHPKEPTVTTAVPVKDSAPKVNGNPAAPPPRNNNNTRPPSKKGSGLPQPPGKPFNPWK